MTISVEQLEHSIQSQRHIVELGAALERLSTNRDFKQVIVDGYLKEEALRLVHLKSDPAMQSATSQASILAQIDAIGNLGQYLRQISQNGERAQANIVQAEELIDEIRREELEA